MEIVLLFALPLILPNQLILSLIFVFVFEVSKLREVLISMKHNIMYNGFQFNYLECT